MTSPAPAVEVPAGTSTATKPVTCVVGELMVLTTTPELELIATEPEAELLEEADADVETEVAAGALPVAVVAPLAAYTVKVGGA